MQPRVDGVDDPPIAAHPVVQLQMAVAIPGHGAHARVCTQSQTIQGMGKLADPARSVVPGVAVHIPFHPARDDFGISVVGGSKLDQRGLQQGLVLHQSEHGKRFRMKTKGSAQPPAASDMRKAETLPYFLRQKIQIAVR